MVKNEGVHEIQFPNGYGASICIGSYAPGEFNVAVVDLNTGELCYDTPVTSDTIRCGGLEDVMDVVQQIKSLPKRMTLDEKLAREEGLCTSVAKDDEENAKRIKCIIDAYLFGKIMEMRHRADDGKWDECTELPCDFGSYRYRVI